MGSGTDFENGVEDIGLVVWDIVRSSFSSENDVVRRQLFGSPTAVMQFWFDVWSYGRRLFIFG